MMKRLAKIKIFLGDAKTREEVKRKVTIDWLKYEYAGVGKKDHVIIILYKENHEKNLIFHHFHRFPLNSIYQLKTLIR